MNQSSDVFMVFCYNRVHGTSKRVIGVYDNVRAARTRQLEWCRAHSPRASPTINDAGICYSESGHVTFINQFAVGDSNVELFTTNPALA